MFKEALAAISLGAMSVAPALAAQDSFDLDATHTYPSFEINHLGFSTMRGKFTDTTGSLTYDVDSHVGRVKATIKAASIDTGFSKRDEHLRSADFFNVEKFPTLEFTSEEFHLDADHPVDVKGTLTLLGVSKPVTLSVQASRCANRMGKDFVCGAFVSGSLHRSDWGLNAFVPFVGDEVKLQIEVEAVRK